VNILQPDRADICLEIAVTYADAERWDESLEASKTLVRLSPKDVISYASLSAAYQALERYQESADACAEALKINPNCIWALEGMGYAYGYLDRYEDEVGVLRRAIELKPDAPYTHAWLAQAFADLGNRNAAYDELSVLTQLDSSMAKEIEPLLEEKLKSSTASSSPPL
jgi:tetratricopeptide (TPR) repeat protein